MATNNQATFGNVITKVLSIAVNNLDTVDKASIALNNVSTTAVTMSETFMKLSQIEQDLKLREATHALAAKTAAMSALLGVEIAAPLQPAIKPALQM